MTRVKWSMNVPWCAMCHHLNGITYLGTRVNILLAKKWTIYISLINILKLKKKVGLNCHMSSYKLCLKMTRVKWSMNVPWCATCHHLNGIKVILKVKYLITK